MVPLHSIYRLFSALMAAMLVIAAYDDFKMKEVRGWLINAIVACGVLYYFTLFCVQPFTLPVQNTIGAFAISVPMLVSALIKENSVGGADIRIMFGIGLLVGLDGIVFIFAISTILAVILLLVRRITIRRWEQSVAFVPFITCAFLAWACLVW